MNTDDLLFEKRNKEYGAYKLRKQYKKTLLISLAVSTIIFLLLVFIPFTIYLKNQYNEDFIIRTRIVVAELMPVENLKMPDEANTKPQPKKETPLPKQISDDKNIVIKDSSQNESNKKDSVQNKNVAAGAEENNDDVNIKNALFTCGGDLNAFRYWFTDNYNYKILKGNKKAGKVLALFSVNKNGYIDSVKIIVGISSIIDNEVKRVLLNSPRWRPCTIDGRKHRMQYSFPVFVSK